MVKRASRASLPAAIEISSAACAAAFAISSAAIAASLKISGVAHSLVLTALTSLYAVLAQFASGPIGIIHTCLGAVVAVSSLRAISFADHPSRFGRTLRHCLISRSVRSLLDCALSIHLFPQPPDGSFARTRHLSFLAVIFRPFFELEDTRSCRPPTGSSPLPIQTSPPSWAGDEETVYLNPPLSQVP